MNQSKFHHWGQANGMDAVELGRKVLVKRKEKGLSQRELGDRVGISRNYVSHIEHGLATGLSLKVINRLAVVLGVSAGELTGDELQITIPPSLREFGLASNLTYEAIDTLARIPKRGKEPKSAAEWMAIYTTIRPYIEGENQ